MLKNRLWLMLHKRGWTMADAACVCLVRHRMPMRYVRILLGIRSRLWVEGMFE